VAHGHTLPPGTETSRAANLMDTILSSRLGGNVEKEWGATLWSPLSLCLSLDFILKEEFLKSNPSNLRD
jgi:hypothetical protein